MMVMMMSIMKMVTKTDGNMAYVDVVDQTNKKGSKTEYFRDPKGLEHME